MAVLTQPQARVPIGWATIAGQRVPVEIDPEWVRYLFALNDRAGGVSGVSTTELSAEAFDDAGVEEIKAAVFALAIAADQAPAAISESGMSDALGQVPVAFIEQLETVMTELADTRAQVAELVKTIQDLKQGTTS